jgi:hypothetical protein
MELTFADLVEDVRHRTPGEQEELLDVLEQERAEARRQEILENLRQSQEAERTGQLLFSADAKSLVEQLQAT